MYYQLTTAVRERFIYEMRQFWGQHPKYRDTLVPFIGSKYRTAERAQVGMVITTGSAQPIRLSADNYMGVSQSYVMMALDPRRPGSFLEWVREDALAIQNNNGVFPSLPGVYYIRVTEHDPDLGVGRYMIDPIVDVRGEVPETFDRVMFDLAGTPVPGTLRVYELPSGRLLVKGVDYTVDPNAPQSFTLAEALPARLSVVADYRTEEPSTGPWEFRENRAYHDSIPGVVLAFGRSVEVGAVMVVVVYDRRQDASLVYGGHFNVPIEIEVTARDLLTQEEIVDRSSIYLLAILRQHLSGEGIEIESVSIGGSSEDQYDDNEDSYYYLGNLSVEVRTDWEIHVPLIAAMHSFTDNVQPVIDGNNPAAGFSLQYVRDPFFRDRARNFEMIR